MKGEEGDFYHRTPRLSTTRVSRLNEYTRFTKEDVSPDEGFLNREEFYLIIGVAGPV